MKHIFKLLLMGANITALTIFCTDNLVEITSKQQFDDLIKNGKPSLVDVYASWCGPCKQMMPVIKEIAAEMPDVNFIKIDADANPSLKQQFRVNAFPTFIILDNTGKELSRFSGGCSKEMFKTKIKNNLEMKAPQKVMQPEPSMPTAAPQKKKSH